MYEIQHFKQILILLDKLLQLSIFSTNLHQDASFKENRNLKLHREAAFLASTNRSQLHL